MAKIIDVDFRTKEQKRYEFKENVKTKFNNAKEFCIRNKGTIIALTPVIIGGVTTVTKVVGKHVNLKKQEQLKDLYCYDRSLGHYWKLKRELSNKEWLEIDRRKRAGEKLADILEEMRVLK